MHASTPPASDAMIENRTLDEIVVGDSARLSRTFSQEDIDLFAVVSGDVNPAHMDAAYAKDDFFHRIIAHGMLGAGLIASVLGTRLPGSGTIYLEQDLHFLHPVSIGDTITATLTVTEKRPDKKDLVLDCRCTNQEGRQVISGTARVRAPTEKVRRPRIELPEVRLSHHERFRALLAETAGLQPLTTAVAHPCDANALGAVAEAVLLMKGSLHTDGLLHAALAPDSGMRTGRRLSHIYLMDVPGYPRPLLVTDAAVNIAPDLEQKRDIVQNAIDLAHVMGIEVPRVALLSAVETGNPELCSTLDAAALCKMADLGQISGGVVDGPLALDNALSPAAATEKGIVSDVAGRADILVVPDLEAGNMLAKQLIFLAGADAAGVVLGARVPIILTSRADAERTRKASCAVAVLIARRRAEALLHATGY